VRELVESTEEAVEVTPQKSDLGLSPQKKGEQGEEERRSSLQETTGSKKEGYLEAGSHILPNFRSDLGERCTQKTSGRYPIRTHGGLIG